MSDYATHYSHNQFVVMRHAAEVGTRLKNGNLRTRNY